MEGYTVLRELGRGKLTIVHHVRENLSGEEFAMKSPILPGSASSTIREAARYATLGSSKHFLRCIHTQPLVMEYCSGGDLFARHGTCDEAAARGYILQALCCLHHYGEPHGDVKLENFMLSADGVLKLIDFGPSGGSKNYLAPELLKRHHSPSVVASTVADLYAVGVCLYMLVAGVYPFYHDSEAVWFKNVVKGTYAPLPASKQLSPDALHFMNWCLCPEASRRPQSAQEAMGHVWFKGRGELAATSPVCCLMCVTETM